MIERRHQQRNIFETVIGSVEKLVEDLIEPPLRRLEDVRNDPALLDTVVERLARRRPRSRTQGRPGTAAEVVLRMLVLKRVKGWKLRGDRARGPQEPGVSPPGAGLLRAGAGCEDPDPAFGGNWYGWDRGTPSPLGGNGSRAGVGQGTAGSSRYHGGRDQPSLSDRFATAGRWGAGADPRTQAYSGRDRGDRR
jgi:hypothetical protein